MDGGLAGLPAIAALWPTPTHHWLVRVHGSDLVDVTRTINPDDWLPGRS